MHKEEIMDKVTTYSARRGNVFVWLASLAMLVSFVFRVIWLTKADGRGLWFVVFGAVLPLAALLFFGVRLPIRGEKYFFVTVRPAICMGLCSIYGILSGTFIRLPRLKLLGIAGVVICVAQMVLYYLTFSGRIRTKIPVLLVYLLPWLFMLIDLTGLPGDPSGVDFAAVLKEGHFISELAMVLGIIFAILSAKKLPPYKEGDPYRFRYGDRMDGRLVRGGIPLDKVSPYIMVNRGGASNQMNYSIDASAIERYIHKKRKEGLKHFGITHVLLASYVRMCAEYPGIMRFLSGQKVYQRMFLTVKMVVKKDLKLGSPETIISVDLDPGLTADEVYERFNSAVLEANAEEELDSGFDKLAGALNFIPGVFLKFVIWFLKLLDYFGLIPKELTDLSPFHGSLFITSMGSLGIPPIYHHLYDFGNIPVFIAFGAKRTEMQLNSDGEPEKKKYFDFKAVTDERIVDGQYYAAAFKKFKAILLRPDQLDEKPETVKEDIY